MYMCATRTRNPVKPELYKREDCYTPIFPGPARARAAAKGVGTRAAREEKSKECNGRLQESART